MTNTFLSFFLSKPSQAETGEKEEKEEPLLPCETYIWTAHPSRLENREWDFAEFVREKQHKWVGSAGDAEYAGEDTPKTQIFCPLSLLD